MIFGGEAAWRWRMLMPATDGTYDSFWRQSMRWLAGASPDALEVHGPIDAAAGEPVKVGIRVRNASFDPASGGVISVSVEGPAGERASERLGRQRPAPEGPGARRARSEAAQDVSRCVQVSESSESMGAVNQDSIRREELRQHPSRRFVPRGDPALSA